MKDEVKPLKEIVVTARRHFKNVENSNFESLSKQLGSYKKKLDALGISPDDMERHKAKLATLKLEEGQIENDTKAILQSAV